MKFVLLFDWDITETDFGTVGQQKCVFGNYCSNSVYSYCLQLCFTAVVLMLYISVNGDCALTNKWLLSFSGFSVFYLKLGRVYAFIESVKRRELLKLCKISFLFKALDHIADNITLCFDAFVGQGYNI